MHNPAPVLENDTHKLLWDFTIQTDHLIPDRRPDLIIINKKKIIYKILDFAIPADHRVNLKECEIELKNWRIEKAEEHESDDCALGTITKRLLKGLEDLEVGGQVETIQMTALLRTARILRRVLET